MHDKTLKVPSDYNSISKQYNIAKANNDIATAQECHDELKAIEQSLPRNSCNCQCGCCHSQLQHK